MSWETQVFYWAGWFASTAVLGTLGVLGTWLLWQTYNNLEKAFRANAALLAAYIKYAYKFRFKGVDPEKMQKIPINGYELTVEKIETE